MLNDIAPSTLDSNYDPTLIVGENDFLLCYTESQIYLKQTGEPFEFPLKRDFTSSIESIVFLFTLNGQRCFGVAGMPEHEDSLIPQDIFALRTLPDKELAWVSAVGHQFMMWYHNNRFCGRCGTKTDLSKVERAIVCPECGLLEYPRISPATIVAITCKDKILLAKGKHYKGDFYALIAGFVEVGESIEETVAREVKEEIGLDIWNIKYYKSQPWPFSGSLMLGFTAEADDTQPIVLDENEIEVAAWFERGHLPNHATTASISGNLIDAFEKGLF